MIDVDCSAVGGGGVECSEVEDKDKTCMAEVGRLIDDPSGIEKDNEDGQWCDYLNYIKKYKDDPDYMWSPECMSSKDKRYCFNNYKFYDMLKKKHGHKIDDIGFILEIFDNASDYGNVYYFMLYRGETKSSKLVWDEVNAKKNWQEELCYFYIDKINEQVKKFNKVPGNKKVKLLKRNKGMVSYLPEIMNIYGLKNVRDGGPQKLREFCAKPGFRCYSEDGFFTRLFKIFFSCETPEDISNKGKLFYYSVVPKEVLDDMRNQDLWWFPVIPGKREYHKSRQSIRGKKEWILTLCDEVKEEELRNVKNSWTYFIKKRVIEGDTIYADVMRW